MLKLGIIGAGRIGKVHTQSISYYIDGAKVEAIADPFIDFSKEDWVKKYGIEKCYNDYKKIINDPEIDAVLICSSTDTHADISVEAINAGKHVFCEKPVSQDLDKIKEVMLALQSHDVKYQVGFNRRFDHNFKAVRESIINGEVGDVHLTKITSRDPDAPPISYVKVSGGMFLDMTIHDFDMVRYLTGKEVEEIYVNAAVLVDKAIGEAGDVDTAIISMKMTDGSLAVIDNSRKSAYGYDQRAEVFGSNGQVAITNDTPNTTVISGDSGVKAQKPLYFFLERYMKSFADEVGCFVDAIENDTAVPVDIIDGLQAVVVATAANKSLKEGRAVKLSEIV